MDGGQAKRDSMVQALWQGTKLPVPPYSGIMRQSENVNDIRAEGPQPEIPLPEVNIAPGATLEEVIRVLMRDAPHLAGGTIKPFEPGAADSQMAIDAGINDVMRGAR